MPLFQSIIIGKHSQLLLWKITESYEWLFDSLILSEQSQVRLASMKSIDHQKGFLAVRMLLKEKGYSDFDLYYDSNGKPHLHVDFENLSQLKIEQDLLPEALEGNKHISISHSHEFSAIVISDKIVGLDLEILKEKTLKIAQRFMDVSHLENLSKEEQLKKATVIWGIKESIFKIKNEVGISFKDHIFENDFQLDDKKCTVELRFNNKIEVYTIVFDFVENYVFVCAFPKK